MNLYTRNAQGDIEVNSNKLAAILRSSFEHARIMDKADGKCLAIAEYLLEKFTITIKEEYENRLEDALRKMIGKCEIVDREQLSRKELIALLDKHSF